MPPSASMEPVIGTTELAIGPFCAFLHTTRLLPFCKLGHPAALLLVANN